MIFGKEQGEQMGESSVSENKSEKGGKKKTNQKKEEQNACDLNRAKLYNHLSKLCLLIGLI